MAAKEPKPQEIRVLPKAAEEEEKKVPEVVKEAKKVEVKRQEPQVKKEASSQPLIDPKKFEEHRRQY